MVYVTLSKKNFNQEILIQDDAKKIILDIIQILRWL